MKKKISVLVLFIVMVSASFAVDFSIGTSFGIGFPNLRGSDYEKTIDEMDIAEAKDPGLDFDDEEISLSPRIDVLMEFTPYLALETGLGFKYSQEYYDAVSAAGKIKFKFNRTELYIPIMLRGQIPYAINAGFLTGGLTFLSAGVKLGTGFGDYYEAEVVSLTEPRYENNKAAPFIMDIALSLGQEFKLGSSHFVGLRVNYDINILQPFDDEGYAIDLTHDDFTVALSYRYAF